MGANRNKIYLFAFFVLPILLCFAFYYFWVRKPITSGNQSAYKKLAYFGSKAISSTGDTIYYSIPNFTLSNQSGLKITNEIVKDKIYLANFFSLDKQPTSLQLCAQFFAIQKNLGFIKDFMIVSHTFVTTADSLERMKQLSYEVHNNEKKWNIFFTSNCKYYNSLAKTSYLLELSGTDSCYSNSKIATLIDKEKRIRGFYDITNSQEVSRLIDEVRVLHAEYKMKERKEATKKMGKK